LNIELTKPPQFSKPSLFDILREVRAPFEFASVALHVHALRQAPRGNGRAVLLVPGYLADDHSMRPLGAYLKYLNYDVYYTELGRNMGKVNADMMRLGDRVESVSQSVGGEKVTLIGWSLGGVLTREVARLFPDVVQEVLTLGTPIVGGPKFTSVGKRYAKRNNIDLDEFELDVHQRNSIGLTQPVTSIYSKSDGVVAWQASVDIYNHQATNIEVNGSHMGLGVNPKVWLTIADVLGS
jgi:pimeloyl-ACP methyl ester carboxylesterase|tara:strand:- start:1982 stop:2695 length:714 start_codon:yes stop_codon:yes gene_type:complete